MKKYKVVVDIVDVDLKELLNAHVDEDRIYSAADFSGKIGVGTYEDLDEARSINQLQPLGSVKLSYNGHAVVRCSVSYVLELEVGEDGDEDLVTDVVDFRCVGYGVSKDYYFPNDTLWAKDHVFVDTDIVCIDEAELNRLAEEYDDPNFKDNFHIALESEIVIYGVYDS